MKKTIVIATLILSLTGVSVFAAMGGHGGTVHHGTMDHYEDNHNSNVNTYGPNDSTRHHYGASDINAMTNRIGTMMQQMSTAMNHPDINPSDMGAIGSMMDRLSENMNTLSQHKDSGAMSNRQMEQMHNELDAMHRQLNSIAADMDG